MFEKIIIQANISRFESLGASLKYEIRYIFFYIYSEELKKGSIINSPMDILYFI